ncbi:GAK system CofD-like protein [Saccharobesus litoralis]|uniref:GAK system CofD-like protein n=1 Tax=Saccharobesus litoralis TaxID=2172099 RepID=A0A2S0VNZ3_9ALTE|nr:GAK system CofD-like protein [Saccharobesus litoralis]AWB65928.1 GAK system CofD-like protein [Saccharobesus litoralis]
MSHIKVSRQVTIPDPMRMSRYQKIPELGPSILFFSGGSALNGLSRILKLYTHNSTHLVTPFDSGGSSAKLRDAFNMPAIGDLRSRLMALADESITGHPEIYRLFNFRLPIEQKHKSLLSRLENMIAGEDELVNDIANPMRNLICTQLNVFYQNMPKGFDLRGASIGNLILSGGYLNNQQNLDQIIFLFSKLVNVQGTVRAVVNDHLHLVAELENGKRIIGQHNLTGKEVAPIDSPIKHLYLSSSNTQIKPAQAILVEKNRKLIEKAELLCYPMGSFYTSLLANLLPEGVPQAILHNENPKVFIPNLGVDPEQIGMSLQHAIETLISALSKTFKRKVKANRLISFVLLDSKNGNYPGGVPFEYIQKQGIQVIDVSLVDKQNPNIYDNQKLVAALLSLV